MNIFIIGGTSGIGLALASYYHLQGNRVGVCGRDLQKLTDESRFEKYQADVTNIVQLQNVIQQFAGERALSLLINCAGSYAEDVADDISYEEAVAMLQTNIMGAVNCLEVGRKAMCHTKLKCYVVIELKNTAFEPEYAGKLNYYLSAVDSYLKDPTDNPSIGILLCRNKDNIEVEFALRDISKPIGVSQFELTRIVPDDLKSSLPTITEIEQSLVN